MTHPALIKRSLFSVSLATTSAVMLYGAPNSEQLLLPSVYMQWDVWEFEVQQLAEGENCGDEAALRATATATRAGCATMSPRARLGSRRCTAAAAGEGCPEFGGSSL